MQKTFYEDGKYTMQDVGNIYIGSKYTLDEILENDEISFKFRLITERYILPEADREDTLESHLYYLDRKSFLCKIYKQIKAKVKINIIESKEKNGQVVSSKYVTKVMSVEELAEIPLEEKEKLGVVVQELSASKFALMTF